MASSHRCKEDSIAVEAAAVARAKAAVEMGWVTQAGAVARARAAAARAKAAAEMGRVTQAGAVATVMVGVVMVMEEVATVVEMVMVGVVPEMPTVVERGSVEEAFQAKVEVMVMVGVATDLG